MNNIAIFGKGEIAERLKRELNASLFGYKEFSIDHFKNSKGVVFIGSLGICVRYIIKILNMHLLQHFQLKQLLLHP